MNRDLVFFVSGLAFGIAAGYFSFRAVSPPGGNGPTSSSEGAAVADSGIGLALDPADRELDEETLARLEARARENEDDAATRAEIGSLYMDAGRYAEAVPWLEASLALEPGDLHARNHLAISYLNEGRLEQAVTAFEENLSRDSNHAGSLLGLGRIKLYVQQDIRGGLAMWEKLIQVAPDSAEAAAVREELDALKSAHSGS